MWSSSDKQFSATLISRIVSSLNWIAPGLKAPKTLKKGLELSMDNIRAQNPEISQEAIDGARSIQEKMSSPLILSAIQIIFALFFGFIVSLIGGLIVRKSKTE